MAESKRAHVIACGVLAIDIRALAAKLGIGVTTEFFEGGLHDRPTELRRRLQAAIDAASARRECSRIVIGYGVCGRGTVGLRARGVPLVLPKAHDCIALFLGSDAAYRREFWRVPGTYYISAGWFEEKVQPRAQRRARGRAERRADSAELAAKYGDENAQAIVEFLNSWQKNYKRAAFIDTGSAGRARYAAHARAMAQEFGWRYEELPGNLGLLEKLLTAEATTDEVLVVPPSHVTAFDAAEGALKAVPLATARRDGGAGRPRSRPASRHPRSAATARLGLGIDAGGTYTDAVLYDFASRAVLGKSKALTTKWDHTVGIGNALAGLEPEALERVDLVAISTTLATNAIVEGRGQKVGLLLMPPYGLLEPSDIPHEPKAAIAGRLEIDGRELEPVDPAEVGRVAAEMVARHGVGAFAVSGYASTVNPGHERQVKAAVAEATGLAVTCGHELSALLNFRTRATTAVLNARIIPLLWRFLRDADAALAARGIRAPVMVVKGDGTLLSAQAALERPIETILSGPAASVAGACYLTQCDSALVVDVGGTTTDTAAVSDGRVHTAPSGARVGGWQTHVQALDMRTVGLGGDSLIACERGQLSIGPTRVAPVAWLAAEHAGTPEALDYVEARLDDFEGSSRPLELLALTGRVDGLAAGSDEARLLALLGQRPHSLAELAERTACAHVDLLPVARLEEQYIVQRCALTPTDLLHCRGLFTRWDARAARRLCGLVSRLCGSTPEEFIERVFGLLVNRLAVELLKKVLDEETNPDAMDDCPACQALVRNLLGEGNGGFALRLALHRPVIGLGAPVHLFLPQAARRLGAEAIIPPHADVANAIGAITSRVVVARQARIEPNAAGGYAVHGLPETRDFDRLDAAHAYAAGELERAVRQQARLAGTAADRVELDAHDRISNAADGTEIFLERVLTAHVAGPPDLARPQRAAREG
ncbi:MAG TPA: DUF1638 domain-containing protein [Planctomycetota bacterium]|nr:DUF1638 domain-containing protein [Planctomycetota bacterium]HRR80343.1 DUF1638 domain-containing protein [Planctomycetota bacterium]